MGVIKSSSTTKTPSSPSSEPPSTSPDKSSTKGKQKQSTKIQKIFHFVSRIFPSLPPVRKHHSQDNHHHRPPSSAPKITGTIYGYRERHVTFSLQENPKSLPMLVLEFPVNTEELQKELMAGPIKLSLDCEKKPEKRKLFEEPTWTLLCNGDKIGCGIKRQANQEDLHLIDVLKSVSTGAGAIQGITEAEGDIEYIRSQFGRVVESNDLETLYMLNPDSKSGPELTILFVRS